jgi:hypothetical protein
MSNFASNKKQLLESRKASLMKQYDIVSDQIESTVNQADKIPLLNKLEQIEIEVKEIDSELLSLKIDEAQRLERNQAYPEALTQWQEIQALTLDDGQASEAIQNLEEKINLKNRIITIQKQLLKHFKTLGKTYLQIDKRLRNMRKKVDDDTETLLNIVEQFLNNDISADDLIDFWASLEQQPSTANSYILNYKALADRLQRGDIVVFLGTDLLSSLCEQSLSNEQIISCLADYVDYTDFDGDFPDICEYIDMNNQFGRQSLCDKLQTLVKSKTNHSTALYQLFAQLESPLLLISVTYDTHLEQIFEENNKKFVVLSHHPDKTNTDILFLDYSDKRKFRSSE